MFRRFVNPALSGPWCLVFLIPLICQLIGPVHAQSQPQVDLTGKNTLRQGPGVNGASGQSDLASKKVLILHSFAYAQPVYKIIDAALIESFVSSGLNFNNLYFEFLDLARNPGQKYRNELINIFRQKYQGRKFDLAVALHQQSLEFLIKEGQSFYPEGPIICILGDPVPNIEHSDSKRPLIYLPFSIDVTSTIKAIFALQPDTRKIVIIAGSAPMDRRFLDLVQAALKVWKGKLDVEVIPPLPLDEILEKVAHLPTKTAILYTNVAADSTGKTYMPRDVARMISRSANAPVFGLYETLLGDDGIVGGAILNHQLEGERTVRLAMQILHGQIPSKPLTILPAPLVPMFDWLQLKRWGMNEAALSANAIILNKPVSPWERYKYYIIGALIFCLLETTLIIFLIVQRRRKKAAEEELNQLFNVSLDLKCIATTEGYFLRLNPAWERILGYTREEFMAKQFLDFVHPDDLDRTREAVSTLSSQQKVSSFENRYRCKDGAYRWLEWSSAPAGRLIYAAARDITERKQAEEALKERLRFETFLAELSARFINLPADRIDSEIQDAQRRICELLNLDRSTLWQVSDEEPGKLLLTHLHQPPGSLPPPERMDGRVFLPWTTQKVLAGETLILSKMADMPPEAERDRESARVYGAKSDVLVPLSVGEGSVFGMVTFVTTREERTWSELVVTGFKLIAQVFANALARKRAEQVLENRLRFEGLVSHLSSRFVNIPLDRVDSEIEDGLRKILEFFRVDHSTLLRIVPDKASFQITHDASSDDIPPVPVGVDLPRSLYPWAYEKLAEKHEVVSISRLEDLPAEANVDRQTCIEWGIRSYVDIPIFIGESIDHIIHVSSVKSERDWPEELLPRMRLLGEIFVNALERKRAEGEVTRARLELLHVERSLRLNEMTASLAHELNQPLAAILSNAQAALRFLKSDKPDLNEFQEIMQDIISDDQRAGNVIRSLRSMMKREEGEKRPIVLNDIVNDVIRIFRSEAIFRNVHIEIECDGSLPPVFGDKGQLQQVVLNLIINGAEAMSRNPSEQKKLILRTQRKNHHTWVSVRDFGPGIDKENLERVFEPFFTTKGTGLGMGLSVCTSIIKSHRGRIWAENNSDGGATFFFELPVISDQ